MEERSTRKRKQHCPQRLDDLDRLQLTWDSFTTHNCTSDDDFHHYLTKKRRKKTKFRPQPVPRYAVPVLVDRCDNDGLDESVYIGYFKMSAVTVATSFPLHELTEESTGQISDEVNSLQSLEIVAGGGDESINLVVQQKVVDPFCCCFSVEFDGNCVDLQSLAHLTKNRVLALTVDEQELNDVFKLSSNTFHAGNPLRSAFSICFLVHLQDSSFQCESVPNGTQTGIDGIFTPLSKSLATVVAQLNPAFCPAHMQPKVGQDRDTMYLPTFKRIQLFYATTKEFQRQRGCVDEMDVSRLTTLIPGMTATLRGYQLRAAGWMLNREGVMKWPSSQEEGASLHPSWTHICPSYPDGGTGKEFFVNFHTGMISFQVVPAPCLPKGGIVADEMGLGKTVEILALIVLHKKDSVNKLFTSSFEDLLATYGLLSSPSGERLNESPQPDSCTTFTGVVNDGDHLSRVQQEGTSLVTDHPQPRDTRASNHQSAQVGPLVDSESLNAQHQVQPHLQMSAETPSLQQPPHLLTNQIFPQNTSVVSSPHDGQLVILKSPKRHENSENILQVSSPLSSLCADMEACDDIVCLCGVSTESGGEEYIQCEECYTWQHTKCVGFNQRLSSHYKCIFCIGKKPFEAKTTLIVSPTPIARQWLNEIKKHTAPGTVKAIFYEGVHGMIHPYTLAQYDIVLTTYDVLRKELYNATTDGSKKKLRYKKKYRITPSPLMAVKWWRLCVDEAQMVESETTKASEMCMHITAQNKWFVTGTPIQREISDLYGLLLLLGVKPYRTKYWWNQLLWQPYLKYNLQPIAQVFSKLLWRNNKKDVASELGIPEQKECIEWLTFSPVEDHFYKKQQEKCQREAHQVLSQLNIEENVTIANVQDYAKKLLLAPLLKLRQACLHPHVVRGGIVSMKKTSMTMGELLQQLIKKAKLEAQESLRQLIGALNGLAGIYRIQGKWADAVESYRTAMSTWKDHISELECDFTQRIHTMEGLDELIKLGHCPCSRAISDNNLLTEAAGLRKKFLEKKLLFVNTSMEALNSVCTSSADMEMILKQSNFGIFWYGALLDMVGTEGLEKQLLANMNIDIAQKLPVWIARFSGLNFTSVAAVKLWVYNRWSELQSVRGDVLSKIRDVCARPPTDSEVEDASHCHLRVLENFEVLDEMRAKCLICQIEALIDSYELALFSTSMRHLEDRGTTGTTAHGSRGESALVVVLKFLSVFVRSRNLNKDLAESAQMHLNLLEEMKREFTFIRTAWQAASEWVQGYDELNMVSVRFRRYIPGETLPPGGLSNVLRSHEVEPRRYLLLGDKASWESELRKTKGQYYYLQSLEKAKDIKEENMENCPICIQQLGKEWCVLPCGHSLCAHCIEQMQKTLSPNRWPFTRRREIRCPVCRSWTKNDEVHLVTTTAQSAHNTRVKGDHSTKIEAVIYKIITIHDNDPHAKILVFSQWLSALELLANGLSQNSISYEYPYQKVSSNLQKSLTVFKTLPHVNILLLPLHMGSNGLNITEATHVILCEPSLNPSAEQQAVSRIHRMGQTRPTTVHRFYVSNTVEDKMYHLFHPEGEEAVATERLECLDTSERKAELSIKEFRGLFVANS